MVALPAGTTQVPAVLTKLLVNIFRGGKPVAWPDLVSGGITLLPKYLTKDCLACKVPMVLLLA